MEVQGRRRETSRHRSPSRFALARPTGRVATVLTPLLSLLPPVVLLVVVQSLSPSAQRLPAGAARFDLAGAWLATEPGALAGTTSWLTAPTLGRLQLGVLLRLLQGGGAQSVLGAAHGAVLLLAVVQAVLLWWVLRRIGAGGIAAGLATAVFAIAPVAVETHSAVSALAVAACWLLAAVGLGLDRRRPRLAAAGVCGGMAIASALTVAIAAPLVVLLVLRLRTPRFVDDRHPAERPRRPLLALAAGFGAVLLLLAAALAVLAALPATAATERLAALTGAQDAAPVLGAAALVRWVAVDPLLAVVGLGAIVLTAVVARDRPLTVLTAVLLLASVWPEGGDAVGPAVVLLPAVAAAVARSVEVGVIALGHPLFLRSVLGSAWLTGVAAVLVVATIGWLVGLGALVPGPEQPVAKAERWIDAGVPAGQTVLVGLGAWPDLVGRGGAKVGWYIGGRPSLPSSVPWQNADYVVVSDPLPAKAAGAAAAVLARSVVVDSFGSGASAIRIRAVRRPSAPASPPPPTTAEGRRAASLRATAGSQLAQNPRIEIGGADRARLLAGDVDIRIALVLAQFVTAHRVTVSGFGLAPGDRSGIRTTVTISAIDGRPVPSDGTKTGVLLRFLSDLRGDFATRSIDATDAGITAAFTPRPDLVPQG